MENNSDSDDKDLDYEIQLQVSQKLILGFNDLKNSNAVDVEFLFNMINENLTYDDPGLLSGTLQSPKHKLLQESTSMWLIHHIIYEVHNNYNFKYVLLIVFSVKKHYFKILFNIKG